MIRLSIQKLNISRFTRINIDCGDILKVNSDDIMEVRKFDFYDNYYGSYFRDDEYFYIEELTEYARFFGIEPEDIMDLFDFGYDESEIAEMLYSPSLMQQVLKEARSYEFIY